MKKKISQLSLDDFTHVIPKREIEEILIFHLGKIKGKKEIERFNHFMIGQTMAILERQPGIYASDLERFLRYRRQGISKKFPLDD